MFLQMLCSRRRKKYSPKRFLGTSPFTQFAGICQAIQVLSLTERDKLGSRVISDAQTRLCRS
jgi:hypothetical protein